MSLYAQITGKTYDLPIEWDKCDVMYRHLKRLTWDYQFVVERRMFQTTEPEYRCALVKWVEDRTINERRREVLVETNDPQHMESVLLMLISEADAQAKAYRQQQQITMLGGTDGV